MRRARSRVRSASLLKRLHEGPVPRQRLLSNVRRRLKALTIHPGPAEGAWLDEEKHRVTSVTVVTTHVVEWEQIEVHRVVSRRERRGTLQR